MEARNRNALEITEAELKLIARAAIIGDNNQPVNGNSTPAASGTPYGTGAGAMSRRCLNKGASL